jgi:hypothetical protein
VPRAEGQALLKPTIDLPADEKVEALCNCSTPSQTTRTVEERKLSSTRGTPGKARDWLASTMTTRAGRA